MSTTATGRFAALPSSPGSERERDSPPPPPPSPEDPAFEAWIHKKHRYDLETREMAIAALDASLRIERVIGVEPQPAQGVEGSGLLKVLAGHVKSREVDERRRADLRLVVGAIVGTLAFIATLVAILKGIGWLH